MKNYRKKRKIKRKIKKRHVGNDNSIAFNDTCDHALRLPFSATHAINLTKDITHTSDTHTYSHVFGAQSNKRCLPLFATPPSIYYCELGAAAKLAKKETRKNCRSFASDIWISAQIFSYSARLLLLLLWLFSWLLLLLVSRKWRDMHK